MCFAGQSSQNQGVAKGAVILRFTRHIAQDSSRIDFWSLLEFWLSEFFRSEKLGLPLAANLTELLISRPFRQS